MTHGETCLLI